MVGFGSSLRMGRRSGWEAAYLDYETLKLLLSQIESVYEEEGHHNNRGTRDVFMEGQEQSGNKRKDRRDYRDELFLESDSDAAFASSASNQDDEDSSLSSDNSNQKQQQRAGPLTAGNQGNSKGFSTGTFLDAFSSDDSHSADETNNCGGVPWRTEKKPPTLRNHHQRKRSKGKKQRYTGDDDYFVPKERESTGLLDTFIVDEGDETFDPGSRNQYASSSLFNAPFQGLSSEKSSLLPQSKPTHNPSFFSFSKDDITMTPPQNHFRASMGLQEVNAKLAMYGSSADVFMHNQQTSPGRMDPKQAKLEEERRRARKQRRRRTLARQRKAQEKKVPQHIRIAHSKARSITERFLGLIRAEVEKVTLFAQARLGELADTAGSLRFLSSEELTELGRAKTFTYEHPLSDGGVHPSASSSSEEGAGGLGLFPWSDSSSHDEGSKGSSRHNLANNFSGGGFPPQTEQRAKFTSTGEYFSGTSLTGNAVDKQEDLYRTRRKIGHFEELRRERPIFQRNDHIVGEDLLLVSAVDEADAYSAVGVELMHILKYILVNTIAVRKICRKHDRLLMNRMLGGYYHRKRTTGAQEERTLGGLIAHVAGDAYDAPTFIGLVNHGKLIGVYDRKIQQLSNSRTVKVISSCLALALSEYEVSRTRADALARLNSNPNMKTAAGISIARMAEDPPPLESFDRKAVDWVKRTKDNLASPCRDFELVSQCSDAENGSGPPSTASSFSLTRLRFTVLSIAALREASRIKLDPFATYLSRSMLSFTGHAVVGEGLDGCSRETLDFLVSYSPDAALLLDSSALYEGLRHGRWRQMSIGSVMRSALAVALQTQSRSLQSSALCDEELTVLNALSILPKSEGIDSSGTLDGASLPLSTSLSISRFVDFSPALLRANRFSYFLYTVNYYIVHPTANNFVQASGANVAYSAAIIGASSFSAMFSAALHCYVLSGQATGSKSSLSFNFVPFRRLLILSSVMAIIANTVHAHGIRQSSVPFAILGRLFLGLANADILHRQFVVEFIPPSLIVAESARLFQCQVGGLVTGLFLGSLNELLPSRSVQYDVRSIQLSNWLMVILWTIQFSRILCGGRNPKDSRNNVYQTMHSGEMNQVEYLAVTGDSSDSSSASIEAPGPARLFHKSPETRARDNLVHRGAEEKLVSDVPGRSIRRVDTNSIRTATRRRGLRKVGTIAKRIRKLLSYNVALSVALALVVYTTFAQEILFTSCALITDKYFGWRGNVAGFFLGSLSVFILPIDLVCEQVARRYEERTTIKRSILILGLGLLVMVNWGSIFAMAVNLQILLSETKNMQHHYYDWLLGIAQYVIGFIVTFIGMRGLHGASRALLSKVSPANMKLPTNIGTIMSFSMLFAQFLADLHILTVALSHRVINTDIVNSLVVPMLIACLAAYYFVRKHFFFLM